MSFSNYSLAMKVFSGKDKTFKALQSLVLSMSKVVKNSGKVSFFGKDKGKEAIEDFCKRLVEIKFAIHSDYNISFTQSDDNKIIDIMVTELDKFKQCFPNWNDAYDFAAQFFTEERDFALKILA
ncbi:MAG TPA: hypothetical protein DDZ34_09865 [Syntrophaceae bacterium]|nr:hypothetical protein [Syntrophaceae bacterium]